MTFSIIDGTAVGNVPLSISDVVQYLPEFFDGLAMVITCVDSSREVRLDSRFLEGLGSYELCGDVVFLPESSVKKMLQGGWPFDGFDEIYLMECAISGSPPPTIKSGVKFTTDTDDFSACVPAEFLHGFNNVVNATRFLADGCGLNFACEPHMAEKLEDLDKTLAAGDPNGQMEDENGEQRRVYYLPLTGPPNSSLSRVVPRRPGKKEPDP